MGRNTQSHPVGVHIQKAGSICHVLKAAVRLGLVCADTAPQGEGEEVSGEREESFLRPALEARGEEAFSTKISERLGLPDWREKRTEVSFMDDIFDLSSFLDFLIGAAATNHLMWYASYVEEIIIF